MARRFAKVSDEEIEKAFFYPSDLVNTKTNIPLRVDEEWRIYIHHYSPPREDLNRWVLCRPGKL